MLGSELKTKLGFKAITVISIMSSSLALGAEMGAHCYSQGTDASKIEGINTKKRLPIASVSKLLTSHWLTVAKGIDYRFRTLFYLQKQEDGSYNIHIQGSRDPYFGAEKLHYVISELNKLGIKSVKNLTFDEAFKFYWFADDPESNRMVAVGHYINPEPLPEVVTKQLRAYAKVTQGYEETRKKAEKLKINMVATPQFDIENIEYLPSNDFQPQKKQQIYSVASRPAADLMKEMNRNSNNHAANQIFEHLGSTKNYKEFIGETLNLGEQDIVMLNGSGDRVDTPKGARYNEATCEATLKIIIDLHKNLVKQKTSLAKVATVVGTNSGTATAIYKNDLTEDAVIAKTGTVNPAVTLGGVASTQKGLVFFMFIVKPDGNFRQGRNTIRTHLNQMIERNGGPKPVNGQSFSFFTADAKSFSNLKMTTEKKP